MTTSEKRKDRRGFASMDKAKQREIARKGGVAAHAKGTAHEWTSQEARIAGRKGGSSSPRRDAFQNYRPEEHRYEHDTRDDTNEG